MAQRIRQDEQRFRDVIEAMPAALVVVDATGHLILVNCGAERMFGYDRDELIGHTVEILLPEMYRDKHRGLCVGYGENPLPRAMGAGRDLTGRRKDGQDFPAEVGLSPLTIDGQPMVLGAIVDITDRKQAENDRLDLERQMLHAQKLESLGVLAGGIAHDFNNLLTAIIGNTELALEEMSTLAPARVFLHEISNASRRAADLARQMLAYSGKGQFVIEQIDANELLEEMFHLLKVSISKKAVLKLELSPKLSTFDGDATQVRQVIMNLIINASEAIGDRSGVIVLSTGAMNCDRAYLEGTNEVLVARPEEGTSEGAYVFFEVADTGHGMDPDTISKIFDPFFSTKFTGRGLGLSATLGVIKGHRGAIKVYSEPGKGTTIKALFPANDPAENHTSTRSDTHADDSAWRGSGVVLIVDDEETVLAMSKKLLEKLGFDVLLAADGREALEVFQRHAQAISFVILDLTMPHMDGEATFREIRRIKSDAQVVLTSGYNQQDATQRFAGRGLAGFIQKPFSLTDFRRVIMSLHSAPGDDEK